MRSQLLRHFAHNHGQNKAAFKHGQVNSGPVQLPENMRFKAAGPSELDSPALKPADKDANPYTYASPTGNGNKDLMTPYYGHYAHHYGPVYQLLTPVSGYGGFPASIDPRGFNAQTQNFTHGVLTDDLKPQSTNPAALGHPSVVPGWGVPGNGVGAPYGGGLYAGPYGGGFAGYNGIHANVNGVYSGIQGIHANYPGVYTSAGLHPGYTGAYNAPGVHPAASLGVPGFLGGLHTTVGNVAGTIPLVFPNGASKGLANGVVLRPSLSPGMSVGAPLYQGYPANGALGAPTGIAGVGLKSPYNPSFSLGMMQHHQVTMNGAANGFGTPGFFHPLSDHYPTPDADPYNSVLRNPVLPPDYGKENEKGSGAGAAK